MKFRLSLLPLFLMALLFAFGACKKEEPVDTTNYVTRDEGLITDYIKANNLTGFERDSAGVYVAITKPGTGPLPKKGQTIIAKYKGTTLDGQVFDQSNASIIGFPFVLGAGQVISGWDQAFKQLNKGSQATLLIPSELAYKGTATGTIPPHSVLRFDVEVVNIK